MQTRAGKGVRRLTLVRFDIQDKLALGIAAVFTTAAAVGLTFVHRSMTDSLDRMYEESTYNEATRVMALLTNEVPAWIARSSTNITEWPTTAQYRHCHTIKTGAYADVYRTDSKELQEAQREALSAVLAAEPFAHRPGEPVYLARNWARNWSGHWDVYGLVHYPGMQHPLLVCAGINTPQSNVAVALRYSGVLLLALAAVVLLAMMAMVRWIVVSPIRALTRNIREIGASADLTQRTALPQDDEIGILSREFDMMLDRLANARRNLMAYSFLAGAENAAVRTLHDVGNAAAPLTVSLDLLRESMAGTGFSNIGERICELSRTDDPLRRQALAEGLNRDLSAAQAELERARRNLANAVESSSRMEDILRSSGVGAVSAPITVTVSPRDLLSTATSMVPPDARAGVSVKFDASLDRLPSITNAHPGLYAVFYAVLTNAVEAVRAKGIPGGIEVKGSSPAPGTVSISICDTGSGVPAEHLPLVFDREFTTKDRPKTMFSLHHCATVVAASGGTIRLESAGPGRGTTVTVTLKSAAT